MKTKDAIIEELSFEINQFLNSNDEEISFACISYDIINRALYKLGYTGENDLDINGWQKDYWQTYVNNNHYLYISGSMYYGNLCINKTNDDYDGEL